MSKRKEIPQEEEYTPTVETDKPIECLMFGPVSERFDCDGCKVCKRGERNKP